VLVVELSRVLDHRGVVAADGDPVVERLEHELQELAVLLVHLRLRFVGHVGRFVVRALHQPDLPGDVDEAFQVLGRPLEVRLDAEADVAGVLASEAFERVERRVRRVPVLHVHPDEDVVLVGGRDDSFEELPEGVLADVEPDLTGFHRDAGVDVARADVRDEADVRVGVRLGGRALLVVLAEEVEDDVDAVVVEGPGVCDGFGGRLAGDESVRYRRNHT